MYNSEAPLSTLVGRTTEALSSQTHEILLVDDGSVDDSWNVIRALAAKHGVLRGLWLMRNYGQHNALLAGIAPREVESS